VNTVIVDRKQNSTQTTNPSDPTLQRHDRTAAKTDDPVIK